MSNESLVNKLRKLAPVCRGQAEIYIEKAADEIERLLAENAELRKDAERYRWLVDNRFHHMTHPNGDGWGISDLIYGDDIDYAIDRARITNEQIRNKTSHRTG